MEYLSSLDHPDSDLEHPKCAIAEFKKALYPNCEKTGLAFSLKSKKCVLNSPHTCYVGYYLRDDVYELSCFATLDEVYKYYYSSCLLIFKIHCSKKILEKLAPDWNSYEDYEDLISFFDKKPNRIRGDSGPSPHLLDQSNFPEEINISKLTSKEYESNLGRNEYLNVTNNFKFDIPDIDELFYYENDYFVRIVEYLKNDVLQYEIDINTLERNYEYENYSIWLLYVPPTKISKAEIANLLLRKLLAQIN